jgi:ankyrin repeat protein
MGQTALHYAVKLTDLEVIKYLLSHGADTNLLDTAKKSALTFAITAGNVDIVSVLISARSPVPKRDLLASNEPRITKYLSHVAAIAQPSEKTLVDYTAATDQNYR